MTDEASFVPDEHLHLDGIPPVPQALADQLRRYTAFAPTTVIAWHPTEGTLLVARRRASSPQLHLLRAPLGPLEPLTDFLDPVTIAAFSPDGTALVYARDDGGNEAHQLYRLDLADRTTTRLTDPTFRHTDPVWNHAGDAIAFTQVDLDAHAAVGREPTTRIQVADPREPRSARVVAELTERAAYELAWSHDDRSLIVLQYRSVTDCSVFALDLASGARKPLLPRAGATGPAAFGSIRLARDGHRLVYTSDEGSEFNRLSMLDLETGVARCLTEDLPHDIEIVELQGGEPVGGERAAVVINVDGRHTLALFDLDTGERLDLGPSPSAVAAGSVSALAFSSDGRSLACTVNSAASPGDVYVLSLASGAFTQWTRAEGGGMDTSAWREPELIRWTSFDGLSITGLLTRPPERFRGPRPVLIHIHGGPASQATVGFVGTNNYFVDELGIAYLQPNVRGSTGYGKTFVSLDDGVKREDSVQDIGALFDWIATQPDLDASRVLVAGRSYGGYMSLAVATNYADRLVASIAIVGISHFTTFLERTETYRRDLRRVEYGDERDPAMRAFFDRISPLANAHRIAKPLFVVAGQNDPRVPYQEGEQMVAKVRANGVEVWHLVADNEGHVFTRKPNIDFVAFATALFVRTYLAP
jgi:dipeptidyl aminopeptidase/acylaminoacyl peptidase